jgi:NADPH:quinone reductase-like Zn-dependent oxidoreductase
MQVRVTRVRRAATKSAYLRVSQRIVFLRSNIVLQLCPDIVFAATPPFDGTLGRYYRIPADLVYLLPDGVSLEDGAIVQSVLYLGDCSTVSLYFPRWNLSL